ncbi:hypothetical protein [Streptomyces sp. B21-105]|uniref:hypothetical protein n=1 Tax=Streptomyces sp. B21-105 TaxID=3039417 RepID=UPI003FA683D2
MAVTDGEGRVLWCSPSKPGSCTDITHARQSGLLGLGAGARGMGTRSRGRGVVPAGNGPLSPPDGADRRGCTGLRPPHPDGTSARPRDGGRHGRLRSTSWLVTADRPADPSGRP